MFKQSRLFIAPTILQISDAEASNCGARRLHCGSESPIFTSLSPSLSQTTVFLQDKTASLEYVPHSSPT